ncbi:MAG: PH domain-containing protein [Phycisphaerae bacterium]|jgi:hypothetical protein|nr:PH domain-containing protein [Phycisphaerae bacterium]|tara:strand:- start:1192 stop:1617 length:426 start_codon:yes stop_codon:yes gene_type:complete
MEDKTPTEEITWSVRPSKEHPKKAVFAWAIIVFFGAFITTTNLILGLCMIGVLVGTQATFLFTSRFMISEDGLKAKYPLRTKYYGWEQVKRAKFFNEACFLFSRKKPSNLDGWSGIAVMYGDNKDEIIKAIKSHLPKGTAT